MVSGAAALRAAAAIAIFAVLVMSSQGHPRKKPLCSDCPSLCDANCTAEIAEKCRNECNYQSSCDNCKSQVLQACCRSSCSGNNGTSSFSCCTNGCSSDCVTCSCGNCETAWQGSCTSPCSDRYCRLCQYGIGGQCRDPCMTDCKNNCVDKHCGGR